MRKIERIQRTVREEPRLTVDAKVVHVANRLAEWVHPYNWGYQQEALNSSTPIDQVCEQASKTPLRGKVGVADDPAKDRTHVRHHAVDMALQPLKRRL